VKELRVKRRAFLERDRELKKWVRQRTLIKSLRRSRWILNKY